MTLFDWMPDWTWHGVNIAWVMLIVAVFVVAALFVFDPCQTDIFATAAGNSCG